MLELVVDQTTGVAVLDHEADLSTRADDYRCGRLGVFVGGGGAGVTDVVVDVRPDTT